MPAAAPPFQPPTRRAFMAAALGALSLTPAAWAQAHAAGYEPRRGQAGKDVVWIPTPDALIDRMLRLAQLTPKDYLMDLGSGDGKIVIAAARQGARGRGIEYNPELVALSRRLAAQAGVAELARFEQADIFATDFSAATVITLYLLPRLNLRLRPQLMALKPGTRIVSHAFRMGKWQPDETSQVGTSDLHLWLVPANAGGQWTLHYPQASGPAQARLDIRQHFQHAEGAVRLDTFGTSLRQARVTGNQLRFGFTDADGHLRQFAGQIAGDAMTGTVHNLTAGGTGAPFTARREGAAPPIEGAGPAPESEAEWLGEP